MKWIKSIVWGVFIVSLLVYVGSLGMNYLHSNSSAPEISSQEQEINVPCQYTHEDMIQGLVAKDKEDGDLSDKILVGHISRFIEKGVCDVTYVVFDSDNQSASITRRVKFTDYRSPQFQASKPLVFEESKGNYEELKACLSVNDQLDGTIKDTIQQTSSSIVYSKAGSYTATFEVTNSFGDTVTANLPVHIVSTEELGITINLNQYIVYLSQGETFDPNQLISDNQESMISNRQIKVLSNNVNTSQAGVYEVQYYVASDGQQGTTWATVIVE